eukprot:6161021-Amphidinium_carterae.1
MGLKIGSFWHFSCGPCRVEFFAALPSWCQCCPTLGQHQLRNQPKLAFHPPAGWQPHSGNQ